MPSAGAVCPFQGEVHLYIAGELRVFLNRGHWLPANQSHGFLLLFFIFFVCVLRKRQNTQNHREVLQIMRGKYARKTRIVTEEKNIAHVYRYSSAQMTDVLARAKLYPD
jgi:hypothetical protein